MNYFVVLNDDQNHRWQAELLIESFKLHNLQDKLYITIIPTALPVSPGPNLANHKNIEKGVNFGHHRGFERLNKLYSMLHALTTTRLRQPFISLEPDSVLFRPRQIEFTNNAHIIFQANQFFSLSLAKSKIPNLESYLPQNRQWMPIGKTFYCNNIPIEYFHQVINQTELFAYEQLRNNQEIWTNTDRVAWSANIMTMIGGAAIQGVPNFEQTMSDNGHHHMVINYEDGLPPYFSKKMFSYALSLGNPFDILANLPTTYATTATEFLAVLARKLI